MGHSGLPLDMKIQLPLGFLVALWLGRLLAQGLLIPWALFAPTL